MYVLRLFSFKFMSNRQHCAVVHKTNDPTRAECRESQIQKSGGGRAIVFIKASDDAAKIES